MTSFLRLNGIAVPVLEDSATHEQINIGTSDRALDGTARVHRRVTKGRWTFTVQHSVVGTALAFRDLIMGKGHLVNWEGNHHYTSKGHAPSGVAAGFTIAGTAAKYGTYRGVSAATNGATWTVLNVDQPFTIAVWMSTNAGSTWTHYVVRSDGAKWVDGVRNDAASTGFIAPGAGVVGLGDGTNRSFDDLVILPYVVPDDWPTQIYSFGAGWGDLARLKADGNFIEQNGVWPIYSGTKINVVGQVGPMKPITARVGGTVQQVYTLEASLEEV